MQTVLLIDAAPGFEDIVEGNLRRIKSVVRTARVKERNFDVAILIEASDAADLDHLLVGQIRVVSGVTAWEKVDAPSPALRKALALS